MIQTEPTMTIRPATEADIDALQELFQEMDRHQARLAPGGARSAGQVRTRKQLQEGLRDAQGLLLVCERKGEIVGCLRGALERSIAVSSSPSIPYLKVNDLVVARRARNAGIGSALLSEAESWARRKRARRVRMDVLASNHEAVSFCDELGFETLSASLEKRI